MGAWEAGILWGLVNNGNPDDFAYDVGTGISAGAINTAGLAGFAPEEGVESAQFLSDTWANITNPEIWRLWGDKTPIQGCLTERGCLDDSYALTFLQTVLAQFPDGYKRRVTLGAGNVDNGDFETFDQENTPFDELHYAALASGSIPGVFPPVQWRDMNLMDGGTIYDVNINSAVHQCLDLVEDESQIIIDVAICAPEKTVGFDTAKNAVKNFYRSQ